MKSHSINPRSSGQDHDLDLLKRGLDIRAVVEAETGPGRGDLYLCPLHAERTGSFHVFADGERWKCFGCSRGGDALDLAAALRGVSVGDVICDLRAGRVAITAATRRVKPTPKAKDKMGAEDVSCLAQQAWARVARRGVRAQADHPACAYLARRLCGRDDLIARLFADGEAGALDAGDETHPWLRRRAAEGYRLVLPLFVLPDDPEAPVLVSDLGLRHIGPGAPPAHFHGAKFLRLPGGTGNRPPWFGNPAAALLASDSGTLRVCEGWGDYVTLRVLYPAVVGLQSTSTATGGTGPESGRAGAALAREIMALRGLGVGGPERVVLAAQADEPGEKAMRRVGLELLKVPGLRVGWCQPQRRRQGASK